jgi:hypothetical protein
MLELKFRHFENFHPVSSLNYSANPLVLQHVDSLYSLVVKVPVYRYRVPWFDSRRYQISEKYWVWDGVYSAS